MQVYIIIKYTGPMSMLEGFACSQSTCDSSFNLYFDEIFFVGCEKLHRLLQV